MFFQVLVQLLLVSFYTPAEKQKEIELATVDRSIPIFHNELPSKWCQRF